MDYYNDVYKKRLNRYGLDYQSRVQGMRERSFELLLEKSIYRIDFDYDGKINPGVFEKYKQDETRTLHYLLTRTNLNIPNGTILMISNKDNQEEPWMIYYLEDIKASGYNRYIMLKMTHYITWKARDNKIYSSWAYLYGQENNMLKDELQARSRADARYTENLKTSFFILPINENTPLEEAYVVTGYDINSTKGVEYITIDPVYIRDKNPDPIKTETDSNEDFFWIEGGI